MSRRTILYSLLFINFSAYADDLTATQVPAIIIKKPHHVYYSLMHNGPKTILNQQQIAASGSATVGEILQNLAGLQLQDSTGNGANTSVSLRGFGSNATSNTLFLLNGIPITNPDLAGLDLNIIPTNEIEYVEIVAGSESVLYGDQAVAGVINIVTQRPNRKLEVACNAGSYLAHNCYGVIADHYEQLFYHFFAGNRHSDNYRRHNDYDQNVALGGLTYIYATGQNSFDFNVGNEDMEYPGALTAQQVRQNRRQANNNTDFFTNWNGFFHLQNQQNFNDNWQLKTDLFRREMHGHGVLFSPFKQSRLIYFLRPQLSGAIYSAKVVAGVDGESDGYHLGSMFGTSNVHEEKYGVYGLATVPFYERASLTLGARAAQMNSSLESTTTQSLINRALATTLGLGYQLTESARIYARRAGSFRFPKADENAFTQAGINGLRTQRGVSYETGVQVRQPFYGVKASVYQLNLRDEIMFDPTQTALNPFGSNRNLAPTIRRGVMLASYADLNSHVRLAGQYNYVNARFQEGVNEDNRIPLVSENIINANLNYRINDYWNLFTEAIYTGNQYSANDDANQAGKIGGYLVFNANLRYAFKQFVANFRVNNIFNKNYYFYTTYQTSMRSVFFYPAPGINFLLTFKYRFF